MKKIIYIALCILFFGTDKCISQTENIVSDTINRVNEAIVEEKKETSLDMIKEQADAAFVSGDYQEAIRLYETILAEDVESDAVYYNLGNCYYKGDDIARAILNYERALLLNPGDDDILFNLDLAKSKTVDKITPISELFFITWVKDVMQLLSTDGWAKSSIFLFILFLITLFGYLFCQSIKLRKIGFFVATFSLIFCIVTNLFSHYQRERVESRENAIIMKPSVTAKSTPDNSGTDLFVLHEGHKVQIKDATLKEWTEIRLEDGNVGWIPTSSLEII